MPENKKEKIDLKEILARHISSNLQSHGRSKDGSDSVGKMCARSGSYQHILVAMKEACRQTLELAAENAIVNKSDCMIGCCHECGTDGVDKQSIIDVINMIE